MIIEKKKIISKNLTWLLRCPIKQDAVELSKLRVTIDGETENLDRESGEGLLTPEDFEKLIYEDSIEAKNLFLVAEVDGALVGFTRCAGNKLSRFRHKAEFGICILQKYWSQGIGTILLERVLLWAATAKIEKISLTVVQTNTKAIQLYKRYGFIEEGRLVKDRLHKDDNYYDTIIMGRFSERNDSFMDKIELILPNKNLELAALEYKKEHFDQQEYELHGSSLFDKTDSYDDWLNQLKNNSNETTVNPGWVVSTTFFAIRKFDNKIVGIVNIRHTLNEFLRTYGGNIGYGVRPSERKKGYATQILKITLQFCKQLPLEKVMLTCNKTNEASRKTILHCGGILEKEFQSTNGDMKQKFWINL